MSVVLLIVVGHVRTLNLSGVFRGRPILVPARRSQRSQTKDFSAGRVPVETLQAVTRRTIESHEI